ncbi:MAG: hypothetical protein EZS28_045081 [Streblomastix strix]|uniref:Secreted protein n=1 Tax=Streblomastix strix TaxID=222440 RepID=A0A5J4TND1_9EUKA|nr:MAG: hypothetical protein EZS28_045081 [Streblomastix strix]
MPLCKYSTYSQPRILQLLLLIAAIIVHPDPHSKGDKGHLQIKQGRFHIHIFEAAGLVERKANQQDQRNQSELRICRQ